MEFEASNLLRVLFWLFMDRVSQKQEIAIITMGWTSRATARGESFLISFFDCLVLSRACSMLMQGL